jgi:hypothetical protein
MTVSVRPYREREGEQHCFVGAVGTTIKHRRRHYVGVLKETGAGFGIESKCVEEINRFGHD